MFAFIKTFLPNLVNGVGTFNGAESTSLIDNMFNVAPFCLSYWGVDGDKIGLV